MAIAAAGTEAERLSLDVVDDPMRCRCRRSGVEEPIQNALGLAACVHREGLDVEVVGTEHPSSKRSGTGRPTRP